MQLRCAERRRADRGGRARRRILRLRGSEVGPKGRNQKAQDNAPRRTGGFSMRVTPDSGYIFSPSDLMNFLGCRHYVYLDLTETFQQKEASEWAELLQQKGLE